MNRFHVATMFGVVVTALLASRVIVLRAARSPGPGLLARLRFDVDWFLRGAKSQIGDWIAANLACRERDAATSMLHDRRGCELSNMHLDPGCIDECCAQQDCLARLRDRPAVRTTGDDGR